MYTQLKFLWLLTTTDVKTPTGKISCHEMNCHLDTVSQLKDLVSSYDVTFLECV